MNAWLLFRTAQLRQMQEDNPGLRKSQGELSKVRAPPLLLLSLAPRFEPLDAVAANRSTATSSLTRRPCGATAHQRDVEECLARGASSFVPPRPPPQIGPNLTLFLPDQVKQGYEDLARQRKVEHQRIYPGPCTILLALLHPPTSPS